MVMDKRHKKNARVQGVKLPAEDRASRARSGEQDASKGSFVHIVPPDPAYKAGLAGHVPAKWSRVLVKVASSLESSNP
jgi:hypothetical protein